MIVRAERSVVHPYFHLNSFLFPTFPQSNQEDRSYKHDHCQVHINVDDLKFGSLASHRPCMAPYVVMTNTSQKFGYPFSGGKVQEFVRSQLRECTISFVI